MIKKYMYMVTPLTLLVLVMGCGGKAPGTGEYVIEAISPKEATANLRGRLVLWTDSEGEFQIEGTMEVISNGWIVTTYMPAGATVEFISGGRMKLEVKEGQQLGWEYGMWLPDVEHEIRGVVTDLGQDGYSFAGDSKDPLVFKLVKDAGYVYISGKGTLTTPDGKKQRFR